MNMEDYEFMHETAKEIVAELRAINRGIGRLLEHRPFSEPDEKETFVPSQELTNIKAENVVFYNYYEFFLTLTEASSKLKREDAERTHIINNYYVLGIKMDDVIYTLKYEDLKKVLENWEKLKR